MSINAVIFSRKFIKTCVFFLHLSLVCFKGRRFSIPRGLPGCFLHLVRNMTIALLILMIMWLAVVSLLKNLTLTFCSPFFMLDTHSLGHTTVHRLMQYSQE